MLRIITPKSNAFLRREYRGRLAATFLLLASLAVALAAVFVAPSYALLDSYERAYVASQSGQGDEAGRAKSQFAAQLNATHELAQRMTVTRTPYLEISDALIGYAGTVRLSALELEPAENGASVTLRGQAPTRDALRAFEAKIDADKRFSNFKLPSDALTKQADIPFSVTFSYHEN